MPTASDLATRADFTVDRERHTIRFTRELSAPAGDAFAAWTDPKRVAMWWDPTGEPLASCEIDLRVGGTFAFVTKSHPDMPFSCTYREINPPGGLVFTAMGAGGRVEFADRDGGTLMTVEIVCSSAEHLDQFIKMGLAAGTSQTLDNLVALLGRH